VDKKIIFFTSLTLLLVPISLQLQAEMQSSDKITETKSSSPMMKTDDEITKAVKQTLMTDNSLSAFAVTIDVITKDGVVTLSGNVDTEKAKLDIGTKVKGVSGVKSVANNIVVKPLVAPKTDKSF
jgi:hyperosmotically inducible protein